jgi:outer membrane protein insertion porin family
MEIKLKNAAVNNELLRCEKRLRIGKKTFKRFALFSAYAIISTVLLKKIRRFYDFMRKIAVFIIIMMTVCAVFATAAEIKTPVETKDTAVIIPPVDGGDSAVTATSTDAKAPVSSTKTAVNKQFADAKAAPQEGIIDDIKISGISAVTDKEVLEQISYGIGMVFSRYKTREDIKNLYKTGKFDDIKMYMSKEQDKNILMIELKEKPQIGKIIIKGNKDVGDGDIKGKLDDDTAGIKIKEGEYLDEYKLKKAIRSIEAMYKERNYLFAAATYALNTVEEEKEGKKTRKLNIEITVDEGSKIKVTSITASGNSVFSADKIKGAMKTKEEGWFVSGTYNDDQFIEDLKAVLTSYYQEGYVKSRINGYTMAELDINRKDIIAKDVKIDREKKVIAIDVPVQEGIKYKLKSIDVTGNQIFTKDELTDKMAVTPGKIFDRIQYDKDLTLIRSMYAEKGHIFTQLKDSYVYDDDTGDVAAKVDITEGPVAYVNLIKVRGNYVTKDKVIIREVLIKEGEPFDSSKIRRSQEAIYNLGFFDNVIIDTEQVDIDKLNLVFEVQEKKTGNVGLGAGYSTVEGLVGYVQLSQSNLFGEGKSFSADVQYGNQKKSWTLSYKDPWMLDTPTSFGVDLWNTYKDKAYNNEGYDVDSYGFDVSLGRKIDDTQKVYFTYRYQEDEYSNIDPQYVPYIPQLKSQISSISPMYVLDTRDDVFDANKGIYLSGLLQLGGGVLGGDYNYIKEVGELKYFIPSFWKFVFGFHALIGNGTGYGYHYGSSTVPLTEKFYCGGTDTVRGYEERALGPIAGGDFTIVTNMEYKLKIVERVLTLVAFYDAGNCWDNFDNVNWSNPYLVSSVGGGIRLTIPGTVMMIRLDWGYGLDPKLRTPGGKIHFNIGNIF